MMAILSVVYYVWVKLIDVTSPDATVLQRIEGQDADETRGDVVLHDGGGRDWLESIELVSDKENEKQSDCSIKRRR